MQKYLDLDFEALAKDLTPFFTTEQHQLHLKAVHSAAAKVIKDYVDVSEA